MSEETLFKIVRDAGRGQEPILWPNTFSVEQTTGPQRIVVAPRESPLEVVRDLAACLTSGLYVLYVLIVPRSGHRKAGRYESPGPLEQVDVETFLARHERFLEADGRHNLWIGSVESEGLVVYDHHNLVYGYGPLDRFREAVEAKGFSDGRIEIPAPHTHRFHPSLDVCEDEIFDHWEWRWYDLNEIDDR